MRTHHVTKNDGELILPYYPYTYIILDGRRPDIIEATSTQNNAHISKFQLGGGAATSGERDENRQLILCVSLSWAPLPRPLLQPLVSVKWMDGYRSSRHRATRMRSCGSTQTEQPEATGRRVNRTAPDMWIVYEGSSP